MTTLGIDLGTGSVKVAVVADDAAILARAGRTYTVRAPAPGWAESDPAEWLAATQAAAAEVAASDGAVPTSVGFSGQMHGVVVVDAWLRPLRPAILWADGRSVAQARTLSAALSTAELSRLGSPAVTGFAATTLAWLLEHEPDVMSRAAHVLQPKDWLRAALGGAVMTDPSDASGTLLYDVVSGGWSRTALAWLGLGSDLLPRVEASVDPVGEIRLDGFANALPCAVGAADTACALAGLGLTAGEGFVAVGSGAQVVRVMSRPDVDESLRTHTFATAGAPGSGWYRIGAVQSAGLTLTAALAWLGATIPEAAAALADGVRGSDPVFVPYLAGERTPFMDPRLRGSWQRLSLATDRPALLRSVLEGVAQAVALGVEAVQGSGDRLPDTVPLVGGGTQDPAFRQLLADATGLNLAVTEAADAAVVGAALLGSGVTRNPRGTVVSGVVRPDPKAARLLGERREMMVRFADIRETA
jgi:xylulokinase